MHKNFLLNEIKLKGKNFRVNNKTQNKNGTELGYSRFLKLRYNLQNSTLYTIEEVRMWEIEFLHKLEDIMKTDDLLSCNKGQSKSMRISYSASDSINIEITKNVEFDTIMVSATFMLIMFVATLLMSLNTTCVTAPGILLPTAGIMSAMFGVSSAFGLLSFVGYPACNLVFVTPFLVFGVGIDDMFIIYSSFTRAMKNNKNLTISELISKSLAKSGVSITITSLTDFTAFMVGVIADFKSVRMFSVYVAFSIIFCYLYQLTLFAGFLCVHAHRIKKNHNSFLFCFEQKSIEKVCCAAAINDNDEKKLNYTIITKFTAAVDKFFKFLITEKIGKAISICVFICYLTLSIWSAVQIKEGLNLGDLVSDNSYYKTYINDNTEMVDLNPIIMFVIYEPIDYDSIENRLRIRKLFDNAQKLEEMSKTFSLNWMDQFGDELLNYKSDPSFLKMSLRMFPPFKNDVVVEKVTNNETGKVNYEITASRFFLQYNKLHFSSEDAKPMHKLQDLCKESGLPVLAYSM